MSLNRMLLPDDNEPLMNSVARVGFAGTATHTLPPWVRAISRRASDYWVNRTDGRSRWSSRLSAGAGEIAVPAAQGYNVCRLMRGLPASACRTEM
jgi:hypothetical protein